MSVNLALFQTDFPRDNKGVTAVKAFFPLVLLLITAIAQAVDPIGQRYIDQLVHGGLYSIKGAAQSIYNSGEKNPEVLDVAAEVLLERYPNAATADIDTLAWVCKALGASGNGRYYGVLDQVANGNVHRKLAKYAKQARDSLGSASGDQYVKGTVSLAALKSAEPATGPATAPPQSTPTDGAGGKVSLDMIRVGMSQQEVYSLLGTPTATTSHQTGKAWVPFNFAAKDLARTIALYKGQGRIIFSHDGYSSTARVAEVIVDPQENGFP